MQSIKQQIKSRTNRFGAFVSAVIPTMIYFQDNMPMLEPYMTDKTYAILFILVGMGIVFYRQITTKPISEK